MAGQDYNYDIEMEDEAAEEPEDEPRDALGRHKKTHQPRKDPITFFTEDKFQRRYRLSKETVERLAAHYQHYSNTQGYGAGAGLTTCQRFCLALRYFATGANYTVIGDYQGVDKSTVSRAVHDVANFFYEVAPQYIKFPETLLEQQRVAAGFYANTGHPRCIGCIDGTHIPIRKPAINEGAFINRKGWASLNAMVTCDADKNIIGLNTAWGGSVADAYAFNASELRREADYGFLNDFFLLGDSGYPLKQYLFTPVARPTTEEEAAFNVWHRSTRAVVEQTIGLLKQRFRCLDGSAGYLYHEPSIAGRIVVACACLHNVANETDAALEDDNDEDRHGNRCRQPPEQPQVVPVRQVVVVDRDNYIAARFP